MNRCPDKSILIRWISGELAPNLTEALVRHVTACEACGKRHTELRRVWDLVGELTFDVPTHDLTDAVLRTARLPERTEPSATFAWPFAWRLAAAIALAAGLGITAGRLTPVRPAQTAAASISSDEMLARTGLDLLATGDSILAHVMESDADSGSSQEDAS